MGLFDSTRAPSETSSDAAAFSQNNLINAQAA